MTHLDQTKDKFYFTRIFCMFLFVYEPGHMRHLVLFLSSAYRRFGLSGLSADRLIGSSKAVRDTWFTFVLSFSLAHRRPGPLQWQDHFQGRAASRPRAASRDTSKVRAVPTASQKYLLFEHLEDFL